MVSAALQECFLPPPPPGSQGTTDVRKWINRPRLSGITASSSKTPDQYFEGHQRADMAEWRPVKIKTDRRLRDRSGRGQPQEPRLVVNKAPDKRALAD